MRVVFHEQGDAEAVAARLRLDGFKAALVRERFAGEDDDEDHAWAVVTDGPAFAVELYAEEYDAWVDEGFEGHLDALDRLKDGDHARPMELPDAPRRIKGHFAG
jgi:8-oxo-dGTP diphosphatase